MLLEASGIRTFYGSGQVLFDAALAVDRGEVVCLLGRNGAGKTTTLRSIMGLTPPRAGSIRFEGEELVGRPPDYAARRGIGYVPDDRLIFPDLTVRENLDVGRKPPRDPGAKPWTIDGIYELFPSLVKLDRRLGGFLSGGEQQMLTIGRTLMGNPSVLLLDEPAEGLAPIVVRSLGDQILRLKQMGQTILLSEQNLPFAMRVADRAYVMSKGTIQFQGSIAALAANDDIKRQYLMV
ncbi:MAG TPA: ABC transporter ATP-binding protein [Plasticicumulans sp.]|nr:MAG: ABC transporter ATP-binding protein [Burkholderiaceae bacterium]HNB89503.1 ABC transporter ATP-binding protein [Plasticicumulans sp.]HNE00061.1 ABC transporter ATP-binding protein [Plasticicumulans sp.]HNO59006.1 ABC transporter ATP-binding protein [Plasticicumulans sp.]